MSEISESISSPLLPTEIKIHGEIPKFIFFNRVWKFPGKHPTLPFIPFFTYSPCEIAPIRDNYSHWDFSSPNWNFNFFFDFNWTTLTDAPLSFSILPNLLFLIRQAQALPYYWQELHLTFSALLFFLYKALKFLRDQLLYFLFGFFLPLIWRIVDSNFLFAWSRSEFSLLFGFPWIYFFLSRF